MLADGVPTFFDPGGRLVTPVDPASGLPYCFAPADDLPPVESRLPNLELRADWNHQFPKYEVWHNPSPALDDMARLALMSARVQWVDFRQHHEVYNRQYVGPEQPLTTGDLVRTLIMAEAGYIPEMAIDLSGDSPAEVGLTQAERRWMWESGQVKVRDVSGVRKFLFRYVVFEQEVDHIHESHLDEFLHTYDYGRRLYLGHCLAAKLVERAVEPADAVYREARGRGALPEGSATHVRDFVKPRLTGGMTFGPVFAALHHRFGAYNRQRKAAAVPAA